MAANGISELATKEARQKAKLELAKADREADGRRAVYDLTELPTRYNDNTVVDNPNPDGLLEGRPWVDVSRTNLKYYIDASNTSSYSGAGVFVYDLSASFSDTTRLVNGVGWTDTDVGGAWTFDASNDYIDTNQNIAIAGDFTINAWAKNTSNTTAFRMVVGTEATDGSSWNYRLYYQMGTGLVVGDVNPIGATDDNIVSTNAYNDSTWHMLTFVRNTTARTLSLYIDGALDKSEADSTYAVDASNSQEVWIGRSPYLGGSYPFGGSIGEVMIYDRALSTAEVSITHRATRSRYGV